MIDVLCIGLIGAGMIGRKHADTIAAAGECRLAAVADPAPHAAEFAAGYGAAHYRDHRAMLEEAGLDGVIVASPNVLHVAMALDCQVRGLPVLVEKPVADTLAAGKRLAESVAASGVPVLVGHHRRHNLLVRAARDIVQGGEIGRLTAVTTMFLIRKADDYYDVAWRREPGAGPVLLNLIHDIDNLRHICGEIDSVQAMASNAARGFAVEDTAAMLLRFTNGALGTATVSDATVAPWSWELTAGENAVFPRQDENCYLFCGSAGSLAFPQMELWRYPGKAGWFEPLAHERRPVTAPEPFALQLKHFCAVIRREEQPLVTVEDALRTLAVVEAIHAASRSLGTVRISDMLTAGAI